MPESRKYRPDIDGLRAVAVLAIVVHHFFPGMLAGGYVGVDVFFVISGYLITGILLEDVRVGRFSFAGFYLRRARRLLPALYAMLACVLVAGWAMLLPSDYASTMRATIGSVLFASNFVFERILADGYFAADAKLNPLLHTWSLGVEEQFYLLYPALLALAWRIGGRRALAWTLGLGLVASFSAAAFQVRVAPVPAFFLAPFRWWELFAGAALACFPAGKGMDAKSARWLRIAGLAAILASAVCYDQTTAFPGPSALLPVLGAVLVIVAGGADGLSGRGVLAISPMVYTGRISYSLYLWHWPLLVFAKFAHPDALPVPMLLGLAALSVALAAASYHLVEQPLRDPRPIRWRAPAAIVMSIGMLALCGFGLATQGYRQRFDARIAALDDTRKQPFEFKRCRPEARCVIGTPEATPGILLWGDSHMLAWAPGFDRWLRRHGRSAVLAYTPACPPMLEVDVSRTPDCLARNREVVAMLSRTPGLRTVVLASRWGLNGEHPEWFRDAAGQATTVEAALLALASQLKAGGHDVVVLGPVPVYATDVPLQLAREHAYGWRTGSTTLAGHRREHARFYATVPALERAGVRFVDPAQDMCTPACSRLEDGRSLYRDRQHLSAFGARALGPPLLDAAFR